MITTSQNGVSVVENLSQKLQTIRTSLVLAPFHDLIAMSAPSSPDLCCNELAPATQSSHDGLCVARQPFLSAAAQNVSRCCPLTSHPDMLLSQEYPAHRTFANDIFSSPTTFFHPLPNCCQITHEAHQSSVGLRQHGTTERRVVEETPSLLFQASSNSPPCVPSATMGIVHGRDGDRFVVADRRMSTTENFMFPNTHRTVPEHVGNVADHAMSDARRLHTDSVIFDKAHSRASFMNMQRSPNLLPPTNLSVPVPAFFNAHNVERELVQPGGGETSKSTETNVERPSMYSLSEAGSGMWRCNGCMYETKRERDVVRHCLSLHHGGRRMFVCPSCGREYSRRDSLVRHSRKTGCML